MHTLFLLLLPSDKGFLYYRRLKKIPPENSTHRNICSQSTKIRGWRAVSAAGLQGKCLRKRSVFSQTPVRIWISEGLTPSRCLSAGGGNPWATGIFPEN